MAKRAGEGWIREMEVNPHEKDDMIVDPPEMSKKTTETPNTWKEERGVQVEIREDSKTVVDWINGKARERTGEVRLEAFRVNCVENGEKERE